jgi:release factor glutamine methyltransferase
MTLTIREAYLQASSFLQNEEKKHREELSATGKQQDEQTQDPKRVVRWMLEHILAVTAGELLFRFDAAIHPHQHRALLHLVKRKAAGEPIQYILGEAAFMDISLKVTPAVLIPRPETELLVEAIEQAAINLFTGKENNPNQAIHIVDIGTGSGTIPITLAVHQPTWTFSAVDLSEAALEIAKQNADLHHVRNRFTFYQGDLLAPILQAGVQVDVLVSNPPYIPTHDLATLQREVQHEPMLALDGGDDGLVLYRKMIAQVQQMAVMPKIIGFELGIGQAEAVAEMIKRQLGMKDVTIIYDLQGIGRHVLGINHE